MKPASLRRAHKTRRASRLFPREWPFFWPCVCRQSTPQRDHSHPLKHRSHTLDKKALLGIAATAAAVLLAMTVANRVPMVRKIVNG